jgi:hypothetical protein
VLLTLFHINSTRQSTGRIDVKKHPKNPSTFMPSWLVVGITKRLCKVITAQQNQPLQITYETPSNPQEILQSCTLSYDWFVEEMHDTHKAGSVVAAKVMRG